jgi:dihydrofolate synthase/folylpolyglutamate synthase
VDLTAAVAWLDGHVNLESIGLPPSATRRGSAPTLGRIEALVALLGSPQLSYPAIHVTGTNGKTSVVRIAVELLTASGLSVGAYTSPHLEQVNERLTWNGEPIGDDDLADLLSRIADIEDHLPDRPSYFEILTAGALAWFADVAVDVAVIEVGVGGTWDATNVVDGQVAVVTNVSVDHVEYLGPTRAEIAAEKSGIVKPDSILVLGETDPELTPIFHERACVEVLSRDIDFGVGRNELALGGRQIDLYTRTSRFDDLLLPLHGAHQTDNAAIALAAAECFLGPLEEKVVHDAFARVESPGRLELVHREPLVVLDGAHNVAGAEALHAALDDEFPPAARTFVIGLLREKDPRDMLEALEATDAALLVCCRPPSARALDPEEIAATAIDLGVDEERVLVVPDVAAAVAVAIERTPDDSQVVVTGSLYVVGAARHALVG